MKLFTKEVKKLTVDNYPFHCIIDQSPDNDFISFKIYPSDTKTSYYVIFFSWKINWATILCHPKVCAKLINYAISNGWNYKDKNAVVKLQPGDFLIDQLGLD
ncbi:hypothetical protein [Paenibacillus eucommiae]|uniref:Uncharacterized protein n=1 Tax=Paenibacillus eucommiae TaxID=1355755 RepID=A0ABS4IQG9_9BACL|nr:hypothetical protein [Paenibacillus eucommiae]MBP1989780.1 hypothetical protein [Paenibacillus eucommiae]